MILGSTITLGSFANTTQYLATQYVTDQPVTLTGAVISAGTGVLGGVIAGPVNQATLQYVQNPLLWIRDRAFFAKWNSYDNAMANVTVSTVTRNITGNIFTSLAPTGGRPSLGIVNPPSFLARDPNYWSMMYFNMVGNMSVNMGHMGDVIVTPNGSYFVGVKDKPRPINVK